MIKATTIVVLLFSISSVMANGLMPDDDPYWQDVPKVITPTRLKQSIRDVPSSISVITSDMIRNLNIRTIPEALRLVPGMTVTYISGNQSVVSYHGTNIMAPRRMQVMVDGMSVYRTGKAEMDWTQIPVNIEDIDRIEVIRGPNTSSYGENAAVGVVNIITRHPEDDWGTRIKFHGGSDGVKDTYMRHGATIGKHSYRLSVSQSYDDGFDKNAVGLERRDSSDIERLNISTFFDISDDDKLEITAGLVDGENEIEYIDSSQVIFPDIELQNSYIQSKWSHSLSNVNEFYIKAYYMDEERKQEWRSCLPQITVTPELRAMNDANPEYAATILAGGMPSGGTPEDDRLTLEVFRRIEQLGGVTGASSLACGWTNQNYYLTKKDIELQGTHVFRDDARIIFGLGAMHAKIDSSTYSTSGSQNVRKNRFFSNLEYKLLRFSTNLGFMLEDESILDERLLSPRVAIHYSIAKYIKPILQHTDYDAAILKRYRILLVEDNLDNQNIVSAFLQNIGIEVDIANNGFEGLDKYKCNDYDIIFVDCFMPKMNGFEFTRVVRECESKIKCHSKTMLIGLTAGAHKQNIEKCYSCGMDDVITKPFYRIDIYKRILGIETAQKLLEKVK